MNYRFSDRYHLAQVLALALVVGLALTTGAAADGPETDLFNLVRQLQANTAIVSLRSNQSYSGYQQWLQGAAREVSSVGYDAGRGWSVYWPSQGGSLAWFDAAPPADPVVAQVRTQLYNTPPQQDWQPGWTTLVGYGLEFGRRAAGLWSMFCLTQPMMRSVYGPSYTGSVSN